MVCGADGDETSTGLQNVLKGLSADHRQCFNELLNEPDKLNGLGQVDLFIAVSQDARLLSLLELAMRIPSDDLDQLLFAAEDYYSAAFAQMTEG